MNYKLILGILFIGLLLFNGCCSSTSSVTDSGTISSASQSNSEQLSNVENGELAHTYTVNYLSSKYEVTLKETAFEYSYYDGTKYLMAYFEIKNIEDSSQYFVPTVYVIDEESEKYDRTIPFLNDPIYDKTLDYAKELPPNTKMSGWVGVEVPEGQEAYDLYFEYTNSFVDETPGYIKWRISG